MSRIVVLCEGRTEKALQQHIKAFLDGECGDAGRSKVRLTMVDAGGASDLLSAKALPKLVEKHMSTSDVLGLIVLVDVKAPPPHAFPNAEATIAHLKSILPADSRLHAHAAQHDVEAWLLPFWETAQRKAGHRKSSPGRHPEAVNRDHPPSWHLQELFRLGGKSYDKPRDAAAILRGQDLRVSANACPQFKAFLNTLLALSGCPQIP
jgi:hypothetical protein